MPEELDPRVEARLRAALHHEVDTLPFTLRAEDVELVRRARGSTRSRLSIPVSCSRPPPQS